MSREVVGLKWAKILEKRPRAIPEAKRVSGAKLAGLRYERALAKSLPLAHGVWWEFEDRNGPGWCQTDFVGTSGAWVVVLEAKWTWTHEAEEQLFGLYLPVVAKALRVPLGRVIPVVVCKKLIRGLSRPIRPSLQEALEVSYESSSAVAGCAVWHHLGGVPLLKGSSPGPLTPGPVGALMNDGPDSARERRVE